MLSLRNSKKHCIVGQGDFTGWITDPAKGSCSAQVHGSRPQAVQIDGGFPRVRTPVHVADLHPLDRTEEGQIWAGR